MEDYEKILESYSNALVKVVEKVSPAVVNLDLSQSTFIPFSLDLKRSKALLLVFYLLLMDIFLLIVMLLIRLLKFKSLLQIGEPIRQNLWEKILRQILPL